MGPRQMSAWSGSTRKPIDITSTPWARSGVIRLPSLEVGFSVMPVRMGTEGP